MNRPCKLTARVQWPDVQVCEDTVTRGQLPESWPVDRHAPSTICCYPMAATMHSPMLLCGNKFHTETAVIPQTVSRQGWPYRQPDISSRLCKHLNATGFISCC